jgi:hypothetical protein
VYETKQTCPVSADLFERQFAIPMHAELTMDQVERVVNSLRKALRDHSHRPAVAVPSSAETAHATKEGLA